MTAPKPKRTLLVDISNILFRIAAVQKNTNPFNKDLSGEDLVGLCMHISLHSIFKWYKKFSPDFVVFAFEGGNNWRKAYTTEQRTRLAYKGNRVVDPEMKHFYQLVESLFETMKTHTSICCLRIDGMEADDEIAGYCQKYASEDSEIFIISGDRDFIQLMKLPGVKLIDPDTGKQRNTPEDKKYEPDLDYWLFLKCVRGDMGDYVPPAYPRVRETRIRKAYENQYERLNFMNEVWREKKEDGDDVVHKVGDLYQQNVTLLSLYDQPTDIRDQLMEGVEAQVADLGKYSHFHFMRFCESFNLTRVREDAMKFVDMFANNQRFLKGEKPVAKETLTKSEKVELHENKMEEFVLKKKQHKGLEF